MPDQTYFNVHLFPTVPVVVSGVAAPSPLRALELVRDDMSSWRLHNDVLGHSRFWGLRVDFSEAELVDPLALVEPATAAGESLVGASGDSGPQTVLYHGVTQLSADNPVAGYAVQLRPSVAVRRLRPGEPVGQHETMLSVDQLERLKSAVLAALEAAAKEAT